MGKVCRKTRSILLALVIAVSALFGSTAVFAEYGDEAYAYMKQLQSDYPYRAVNTTNGMLTGARDWLLTQVHAMGYETMTQSFAKNNRTGETVYGDNLIFSKTGESDRVIVIGAHYDSVLQTFGTDDNASGVGVLLELAGRYSTKTPPYTLRFILFSAEEPGCLGSQYYVENLSQEERDRIVCMINIDTIASGDYMYLYGGGVEEDGSIVRDWPVFQALADAELLGLPMSFHPDVNPDFPVPTKITASDQMAFNQAGIPYLYCEASNWTKEPYTNFYQTENPAVEGNVVMHQPEYDNITFINQTFGTRAYDHLQAYTKLLDYFIENLQEGNYYAEYAYEETELKAAATGSVYLRGKPSRYSEALSLLEEGTQITVTGYHDSWCRVSADGQEGYIKTEFLDVMEPEESTEASTEASTEEGSEATAEDTSAKNTSEDDSAEENETQTSQAEEAASKEYSAEELTSAQAADASGQETTAASAEETSNLFTRSLEFIKEQLRTNPMAVRIILIALIVIIGIWMCVLIAIHQRKKDKQFEEEEKAQKKPADDTAEDTDDLDELDDFDEEPFEITDFDEVDADRNTAFRDDKKNDTKQ